MKYITNKSGTINLPWEPGLLEWLRENYAASDYRIVGIEYEYV